MNTKQPKHQVVLEALSKTIATMQPGDKLPSEEQLSAEFGVSPMTVRRALQVLSDANRIVGVRGKGTFVAQHTVTKKMGSISFTESMRAAGMTARAELVSASLEAGDEESTRQLGIPDGALVIKIARLRLGDNIPMCINYSVLDAERFPGLLGLDITGSLWDIMRKKYGVEPLRSESRITAVMPTRDQAELLQMSPNTPCVRVNSRSRDKDGLTTDWTVSLYHGDRYELLIDPEATQPSWG